MNSTPLVIFRVSVTISVNSALACFKILAPVILATSANVNAGIIFPPCKLLQPHEQLLYHQNGWSYPSKSDNFHAPCPK